MSHPPSVGNNPQPLPLRNDGNRPGLQKTLESWFAFVSRQIIPILISVFIVGSVLLFGVFSTLSSTLTESIVIQEAKRYSQALSEFRSLYTSEVVSRVAPHGVTVTHDYKNKEGAIPLPATFSMLLGDRLGTVSEGTQVRLFSRHPFPWRKDGGPRDEFERKALDYILSNPTKPFYQIEKFQGQDVLRYATGDLMKDACVDCHNRHPDSPKRDWQVNDVRGILEVIQPLGHAVIQTRENLHGLLVVILALIGMGIGTVALVIMSLRRNATELEQRVQDRTSKLTQANKDLDHLVNEHKTALTKFRMVLEATPESIIMVSHDNNIKLVNSQAEKLFSYARSELLQMQINQLLPDWSQLVSQFITAKPHQDSRSGMNVESIARQNDGSECSVELGIVSLETPDGKLLLASIRDITERKQLEAQLGLAQKMESIGQLAAGIAHEIITPTLFVSDNLRFLTESFGEIQKVLTVYDQVIKSLPPNTVDRQLLNTMETTVADADLDYVSEEIPKALQQSLDGSERVGKIVRAMKEFSHPGTAEKKPIDLNQAIESTITVARNEWKYVAEVVTDFDPQLPFVPCLPGEFNQVILNLLINAAHAIEAVGGPEAEGKGTITVSTRTTETGAEIRLTDTGTGIPEAARSKLFDPFFTTKEVGKGTGQGLAIAHDVIVNKHGGSLTFETTLGVGTTFVIQLPRETVPSAGGIT